MGKKIKKKQIKVSKKSKKTAGESLSKLKELLRLISRGKYLWESSFDAIAAPVHIVSSDFRIDRLNMAAAGVAKKDVATIVGYHCYSMLAGDQKPCADCPVPQALKDGHAVGEVEFRGRTFDAHAYSIKKVDPPLVVVTYRETSEEQRLKKQVVQQEKMAAIGMLAGGIAHEINNPLGGILAFTQLLLRSVNDEQISNDLREIEDAALRCKRIISDLLDFSRSSKEGEKRLICINDLISRVFPFVNRELKSYNIALKFRPTEGLPLIAVHPDRIQQVFLNLITNACHAMPGGGNLSIETKSKEKEVLVVVSDTGHGMSPEICARIFEPFFTTKDPGKGTGLGLAISYRIIADHGGRIDVESAEGKGSKFTVRLPVTDE